MSEIANGGNPVKKWEGILCISAVSKVADNKLVSGWVEDKACCCKSKKKSRRESKCSILLRLATRISSRLKNMQLSPDSIHG